MVVTLPTTFVNGHGQHHEEKKSYPSPERARAMHLSRQLQMRLQYAKLKVENGWTKQRINEVENLYFHLSHARGSARTQSHPTTSTPNTSLNAFSVAPAPKSALSFKSNLPLTRKPTVPTEMPAADPAPTQNNNHTRPVPVIITSSLSAFTPPSSVSPLQPSPFPPDSLALPKKTPSPTMIRATPPIPIVDLTRTQTNPWPSPALTPNRPTASDDANRGGPGGAGKDGQEVPIQTRGGGLSREPSSESGPGSLTYDSFWSTQRSFGSVTADVA